MFWKAEGIAPTTKAVGTGFILPTTKAVGSFAYVF